MIRGGGSAIATGTRKAAEILATPMTPPLATSKRLGRDPRGFRAGFARSAIGPRSDALRAWAFERQASAGAGGPQNVSTRSRTLEIPRNREIEISKDFRRLPGPGDAIGSAAPFASVHASPPPAPFERRKSKGVRGSQNPLRLVTSL